MVQRRSEKKKRVKISRKQQEAYANISKRSIPKKEGKMSDFMKGLEVDPTTGRPKEQVVSEKQVMKEKKLESEIAEGMITEHRLETDEGKFFVNKILAQLEARIDQMVRDDPQAQAYLTLLNEMGGKVQAGRSAAARLVKSRLQREVREFE